MRWTWSEILHIEFNFILSILWSICIKFPLHKFRITIIYIGPCGYFLGICRNEKIEKIHTRYEIVERKRCSPYNPPCLVLPTIARGAITLYKDSFTGVKIVPTRYWFWKIIIYSTSGVRRSTFYCWNIETNNNLVIFWKERYGFEFVSEFIIKRNITDN